MASSPFISVCALRHPCGRLGAWNRQRSRLQLIKQAQQQALADVQSFTQKHNELETHANANSKAAGGITDRTARLASLRDRSAERQFLSIYDDRIQTEQQLATIYQKWAAQVELQHRIVLHLILQSLALILFILICHGLG